MYVIAGLLRTLSALKQAVRDRLGISARVPVVYQLVATVVPFVILVQFLAMLILEVRAIAIANARAIDGVTRAAEARAPLLAQLLWKLDYDLLRSELEVLALDNRVVGVFAQDDTGAVVVAAEGHSTHDVTHRIVRPLMHDDGGAQVRAGNLIIVYAYIPIGDQLFTIYGSGFLISGIAALVLCIAMRRAADDLVGRPLAAMMRAISLSHLHGQRHKVALDSRNEFGALADAFNKLQEAQARSEAMLENQATHDELTGLPNRRLLQQRLGDLRKGPAQTVALHFIDLDDFKGINDTFGHEAGDRYLVHIARQLRESLSGGDWVARLGGDEFIVLQHNVEGEEGAEAFAAALLDAISVPVDLNGKRIVPRGSIGVAVRRTDDPEVESLLCLADIALYHVKEERAGGVEILSAELLRSHARSKQLTFALPSAFAQNQFEVWFQGQFDIGTGRLAGLEALVRWRHPEQGLISPAEFVPLIEQSGASADLARLVFDRVCQARLALAREGLPRISIGMNVSPHELTDFSFALEMVRTADRHGVTLSGFEIEITEGLLINNVAHTLEALDRIRSAGVSVALDDFGQGYSSLAYLRRFPLDKLKIDKAFMRDVPGNAGDLAILEIIVALADKLQLEVVAEGVERLEQVETLRRLGVRVGQGYYFHRPQPLEDVIDFIRCNELGAAPLRVAG